MCIFDSNKIRWWIQIGPNVDNFQTIRTKKLWQKYKRYKIQMFEFISKNCVRFHRPAEPQVVFNIRSPLSPGTRDQPNFWKMITFLISSPLIGVLQRAGVITGDPSINSVLNFFRVLPECQCQCKWWPFKSILIYEWDFHSVRTLPFWF